MSDAVVEALKLVAYAGIVIGTVGTVVPVVPGPSVVWLSALLWAWADGFGAVGWPTLLVMGGLGLLATGANLYVTAYLGRRTGVAWRSLLVAMLGSLAGALVFAFPGAVLGGLAGLLAAEASRHDGDWRAAWTTSRGAVVGYVAATAVELVLVGAMVFVFTVQAFAP